MNKLKSTGDVRKIDTLGRIALPIKLRRLNEIAIGDSLEIYADGDTVVIEKYKPCCIFCQNIENIVTFKNKNICKTCFDELINK